MAAVCLAVVAGILGLKALGILLNILQLGALELRMLVTWWLGLVCILGLHSLCVL